MPSVDSNENRRPWLVGALVPGWWVACFALPVGWFAGPLALALALLLLSRDVAVVLRWHEAVPRPRGLKAVPVSYEARRLSTWRLAVSVVALSMAVLFDTWSAVGLVPVVYALSSAVLLEHFLHVYGGPSYPRLIFAGVVRQVVGSDRAAATRRRLRSLIWCAGASAVVGALLSAESLTPARQAIASLGVLPAWEVLRDGTGFDIGNEETSQPEPLPTETDSSTTTAPAGPSATDLSDQQPSLLLEDVCGTTRIEEFVPELEEFRDQLEDMWHLLGGEAIGCPTGRSAMTATGTAIVYFEGGTLSPAALVASGDAPRSSLVRPSELELLERLQATGVLLDVRPLESTTAASYQLFDTTDGCVMGVHTFGVSRGNLSPAQTAGVLEVAAHIGGTIRFVDVIGEQLVLQLDLDGAIIRVTLRHAPGGYEVESGPAWITQLRVSANISCDSHAAMMVAQRS